MAAASIRTAGVFLVLVPTGGLPARLHLPPQPWLPGQPGPPEPVPGRPRPAGVLIILALVGRRDLTLGIGLLRA
jgi:hypothetical protein